jgi:hypothetical protein
MLIKCAFVGHKKLRYLSKRTVLQQQKAELTVTVELIVTVNIAVIVKLAVIEVTVTVGITATA